MKKNWNRVKHRSGIGLFINEKRVEQGLTQTELRGKSGVSEAAISVIEEGDKVDPKLSTINNILHGLGYYFEIKKYRKKRKKKL